MTAENATALELKPQAPAYPLQQTRHTGAVSLINEDHMLLMHKLAVTMASGSATVPQHLRGNVGDCLAVCLQAERWGMSPFVVAQKTHLVNGQLGYEAQLVAAVVNTASILSERLRYEWFGPWEKIVGKFKTVESRTKKDDNGNPKKFIVPDWDVKDEVGLGVRCWATIRGEDEPRVMEILMAQARTRNSTLWTEDPKQQIAYLISKRWARLHAPEVLLGVYTPDEFAAPVHMGRAEEIKPEMPAELRAEAEAQAALGKAAFLAWWQKQMPSRRRLIQEEDGFMDSLQASCNKADAARTVDNGAAPTQASEAKPVATARSRKPPPAPAAPVAPSPAAEAPAPAPSTSGAPIFTAETIDKRLRDAPDIDALYIAADLISHVTDPGAIAALEALFDERKAALEA